MGAVFDVRNETLDDAVRAAASVLSSGGVAVFPTDTVYGIGQSVAANPNGPARLFEIKRRDLRKVVPWLVGSKDDLVAYGEQVPRYAHALVERFWPGGLTIVVKASSKVPRAYRAEDGTVALRMPNSPVALAVIHALGSVLATTSANTSGCPAPVSADALEPRIVGESDIVLAGSVTVNEAPSTIVVCTGPTPVIVRAGAITEAQILESIGMQVPSA